MVYFQLVTFTKKYVAKLVVLISHSCRVIGGVSGAVISHSCRVRSGGSGEVVL